jgi:hypothetical protein
LAVLQGLRRSTCGRRGGICPGLGPLHAIEIPRFAYTGVAADDALESGETSPKSSSLPAPGPASFQAGYAPEGSAPATAAAHRERKRRERRKREREKRTKKRGVRSAPAVIE